MRLLAQFLISRRNAWAVVIAALVLAGGGLYMAGKVQHEDDLLAFLPEGDPDVRAFHEINHRFGGLDLALVGVATDDAFKPDFLLRLQQATRELKDLPVLGHVLTLTNVLDFTPDEEVGGIVAAPLVDTVPRDPAALQALRHRVMSRDTVVGNLVSRDGKAVQLYCFLANGVDQKEAANKVRAIVSRIFPEEDKYWGGGPFISTYIYGTTQEDLRRLTPWAVLAIVLIMAFSFRNMRGTMLALLSTAIGIVASLGLMASLGVRFNLVLGSMPVILFALGSAYGIHILARYYALVEKSDDPPSAVVQTLTGLGPTVLAAGLTTAASLLSFMAMDILPMRTFGLFTAIGIGITLILSLTFIPAVALLLNLRRKQRSVSFLRGWMIRLSVLAQTRRVAVGVALGLLAVVGAVLTSQVDNSVDMTAFFAEDSPPDRAARFMRENFGGDQFIQLHVEGEMSDPHVLRELRRVADEISRMPHVSAVLHIGQAVALVNEAMVGQSRIPETTAQVRALYPFLEGDAAVAQLVTQDHKQALLQIKVASNRAADLEALLAQIEAFVVNDAVRGYRVVDTGGAQAREARDRLEWLVSARIRAAAFGLGVPLPDDAAERLIGLLDLAAPPASRGGVETDLRRYLRSSECAVQLPPAEDGSDQVAAVAAALVELGPDTSEEALIGRLSERLGLPAGDPLVEDLAFSMLATLEQIWRDRRAAGHATWLARAASLPRPADADIAERFDKAMAAALLDLDNPSAMLPAEGEAASGTLALRVNGLPVLHRGLARSAKNNQLRSLIFALVLVLIILSTLYRSLSSGMLATSPTLITLLVIYGGMGLLGVHLDIGTAMLASIILGAGVDYGVHLCSAWSAPENGTLAGAAARAADRTGPAIWTNAITVCAGFFVLTLGQAKPLQNVGGLTAAAMITAALATFLTIPVLARKLRYTRRSEAVEVLDTSEAALAVLGKAEPIQGRQPAR